MATTPKTVRTYPINSVTKDFTIPFEYLARKFVVVTLIGATRRELILNTEYRFSTATTITTTKAWGPSDNFTLIEIRRLTSATERLVDFADGSILRAYDLNISSVQSLHIAEEARDLTADTIGVNNDGNLDARARKIVNLADATEDGDAVNLRMQKQWAATALNYSQAAAVSAQQAADRAAAALASANASAGSASSSLTYSQNSANSASASQTSRLASETAKTAAEAARDLAQLWASKPEDQLVSGSSYSSLHYSIKSSKSATASQTSATNSATSATQAAQSVVDATAQADRAKTEADKLGNANAFMASINDVNSTTPRVTFKAGWQLNYTTAMVDNIYGRSGDVVEMQAANFNVRGALSVFNPATFTKGVNISANGLTVTGAGSFSAGLTAATLTLSGSAYVKSVMQVSPQAAESENVHVWFRALDGSTERALLYADSGKQLHIRTAGGAGGEALVRSDNSWSFGAPIEATRSAGRMNIFYSPYAQIDGGMYGNTNLQLQGTGGGYAGLGFHNAGRVASTMWLNSDNNPYWMKNSGVNALMLTTETLMGQLAGLMTADVPGGLGFFNVTTGTVIGPNGVIGGGSLKWSSHNSVLNQTVNGSWRCLGYGNNGGSSLWVRYA